MCDFEIVFLEFPESEEKNLHRKLSYFKIYGMESEKPIVRINQCVYEGRWFLSHNFPLIFRKKVVESDKIKIKPLIFFSKSKKKENPSSKRRFLNLGDNVMFKPFHKKRLRLYRLPLTLNPN